MDEKEFLKKMENLKKPEAEVSASRSQVRLMIMNAKKSAAWGTWFLVIPVLFFCSVVIKELFQWNWGIAESITEWASQLDKETGTAWLTPVLFVLLPAAGAVFNLLAIMHFVYDKLTKELTITIKLKWFNIVLAVVSIAFIGMILLYGIMETAAENALKKHDVTMAKPQ